MVDVQGLLLVLDKEQDFVRERGNQSIGACLPFYFSLYFLSGCFLSFPPSRFFSISWYLFSNSYFLVMVPVVPPFFIHDKVLFL